jgi:D-glycero-alpha-D-manno-heptose-7-phosphate kinase
MSHPAPAPLRVICSSAPIRIGDCGGWTDTWFAGHGAVCNIAVAPRVQVEIAVYERVARPHHVTISAENYGERFALAPGDAGPPAHRLLAGAVAELPPPPELAIDVAIRSEVPAGCSTGTSAAACVALLGALDRLTPGRLTAHEVAYAAHRVETGRLGLQSGIQDQLCAAYGGVSLIEMHAYPYASVSPIPMPDAALWELERRLLLVFLGRAHSSSAVHEQVIAELEAEGSAAPRLERLRATAFAARDALFAGDFPALGAAMADCTAAQAALHPSLVSPQASGAIATARAHGALGWKVNGAGGEGGSLTFLCDAAPGAARGLAAALQATDPRLRAIPIALSRDGLRVWSTAGGTHPAEQMAADGV